MLDDRLAQTHISQYAAQIGGEIVPWIIYDTEEYHAHTTLALRFFQRLGSEVKTNMYYPGMLPNPQEFLIESVRLTGISRDMLASSARLQIGAKIYGVYPAVALCLKGRGFRLSPPLYLHAQQVFSLELKWDMPGPVGIGVQGVPVYTRRVQAELIGKLVRPRQ